jgi:hypothetical protein
MKHKKILKAIENTRNQMRILELKNIISKLRYLLDDLKQIGDDKVLEMLTRSVKISQSD